jgi:hypothetical protein
MSRRRALLAALVVLAAGPGRAEAGGALFFLELQALAAYVRPAAEVVFYSHDRHDAMQKPSLGFDTLLRIPGRGADRGVAALQVRLAYDADRPARAELQVYNAFVKLKLGFADVWAGHNRPALGLSSVLDSHAELLQPLTMRGIGFDRDWGLGLTRDFAWGSGQLSLTAGSGMALRLDGNYLAAARVARGVLDRDYFSVGVSAAAGRTLEAMGVHLMPSGPAPFRCLSLDASYLWRRLESRVEMVAGKSRDEPLFALFGRGSLKLLEEDRLRLEVQPAYVRSDRGRGWELAAGLSYRVNADLTLRSMAVWDPARKDRRLVVQAYYYKAL